VEDPVLTLSATRLQVEPGGQAQLSVTVKNPGHLVESFRLDVVGLDPTWWQVHPPELPVYPGKEETALIVLSPPAGAQAPDAALPFGVRAVSTLDAQRSVVEEGDLEVGRILDLQATILPVTSRGRWFGNYQVTYTNWGNSAVFLRLSASDKDGQLGFQITPDQVSVPVGGNVSAKVRARAANPFFRGTPVHRPFQIVGESGGSTPTGTPRTAAARAGVPEPGRPVVDGALQQIPILSRSTMMFAGLFALGLAGLIAMMFRTSQVRGATIADVAPATPTGFTAAAPGATVIQLRWNPSDRAQSYEVRQVERKDGSTLKVNAVPDGATAFADQVKEPLSRRCYTVAAVRGGSKSQPSKVKCATTRDDALKPPTNVQAEPAGAAGFKVSWTGNERNDHVVLVDNAPVGQPSPAGVSDTIVAIPAGQHCVSVLAKRGTDKASLPSKPPVCVESSGVGVTPPPTADPGQGGVDGAGGGGGGGGGGEGATDQATASPTPDGNGGEPGNAGVTGWVAVFGAYPEQSFADRFRDRARENGFDARILQLPVVGLPPEWRNGMVVVVDRLPDQPAADRVCTVVTTGDGTPCRSVFAQAG
jgi:hypothetical protein